MSRASAHFQPTGNRTDVVVGKTLLDLAVEAGASIESLCAGSGKCGKCRAVIISGSGNVSPPNESERKALTAEELEMGVRLACQAKVVSEADVVVEIPDVSRRSHHRLLARGIEPEITLNPAMKKVLVRLPPATLQDVRADDDRLLHVLEERAKVSTTVPLGIQRRLPQALRDGDWETTVTIYRDTELVGVDPGDTTGTLLGVAVDIGTTKMVAYLLDLTDGRVLGTESMPNPQIPFGEDVMSRITYTSREEDGLGRLQKTVVDGLNDLMRKLCGGAGAETDDILEVMMVGNTAMHHIFFGIPATHLASAPYAPVVRGALSVDPGHIGVEMYPFGKVSALPNIAGFVGADAMGVLISSGLYDDDEVGMMIDIGTNTEIIAGNRDRLISCSAASGPAFEGAHIRHGMRASTGAVEKVWIDPADMNIHVRTVDDAPARGICGSGIVDALAQMFKAGVMSETGKLAEPTRENHVREASDGKREFVLVSADDAEGGREVTVAQSDIQEIQLAKAAIFTGVSTLMRKLGVRCADLRTIYAAGAFGTYVDAESAITLGMYPDVPPERIKFVGNAAGSGARMALKSVEARDLAERLSRKVEYVELAAEKDFQTEFAKAMFIPHRDVSRFPSMRTE